LKRIGLLGCGAIGTQIALAIDSGKIPGIWTGTAQDANRWASEGCLFVTAGTDGAWVGKMARQTLDELETS